jgi:AhpD family alkylhydroperoxidase
MNAQPTLEQVLAGMSASLNGTLPRAVQLASTVLPEMVLEHARNSAFAMPKDDGAGALDNEARTLIYLGIALATGSHTCIDAMMNKARAAGIDKSKILETFKIARFAEASRVLGNAEPLLEQLAAW